MRIPEDKQKQALSAEGLKFLSSDELKEAALEATASLYWREEDRELQGPCEDKMVDEKGRRPRLPFS